MIVSALEKVMSDIGLPKFLGKLVAYRLIYTPKKGDEKINISTSLKETKEPVMIYSSGVNDLMREVGAKSFWNKRRLLKQDIKTKILLHFRKNK